jgi:serine/threonine-protein kinase
MDTQSNEIGVYWFDEFKLDPVGRKLSRALVSIDLTGRLFEILLHLVRNHARIVPREELERAVWGGRSVDGTSVAVAISSLRKQLHDAGAGPGIIVTIPGQGYRLATAVRFEPKILRWPDSECRTLTEQATPPAAAPPVNRLTTFTIVLAALLVLGASATAIRLVSLTAKIGAASLVPPFAPPARSVAVMPFTNASGDPKQEYFANGLAEELINALSEIRALQVMSRVSTFSFKGKSTALQDIARQLNVSFVLQGNVRRSATEIHVEMHLTDGVTGRQIWSQDYTRDQADTLKLQTELAAAVASALQVKLGAADIAMLTVGATNNPKALDAFLRATALSHQRDTSQAQYDAKISELDTAIRLDPDFAIARAHRSLCMGRFAGVASGADAGLSPRLKNEAIAEARRAISLAPELAIAHLALALSLNATSPNLAAQEAELARARELAPGDANIATEYGAMEITVGHIRPGIEAQRQAVALNPLKPTMYYKLAWGLFFAKQPDEAKQALRRAKGLGMPKGPEVSQLEGYLDILSGDPSAAEKSCKDDTNWQTEVCLAIAYHANGKQSKAEAELKKLMATDGDTAAYNYTQVYAQWDRQDLALQWLERAFEVHDTGVQSMLVDPFLDPIRRASRFGELLQRANFPP